MIFIERSDLWLGTESSLISLLELQEKFSNEGFLREVDREDKLDNPVSLEMYKDIAVIGIEGMTVSKPNFFTKLFGIPSYIDIEDRISEALSNPEVKEIVLNVNTPGGAAKGAFQLADFVEKANKVKPVYTYANELMASAGLLYGSAARKVVADKDAELGSLGALAVHTSYARLRKEEGYDDTVLRTAPNKALGHPLEPFSDKAKEKIMQSMNKLHNKFAGSISRNRKLSLEHVLNKVATGDLFEAQEAERLGLADSVDGFESFLYSLSKKRESSSQSPRPAKQVGFLKENVMTKKVLSEALVAALAAGLPADTLEGQQVQQTLDSAESQENSDTQESLETETVSQPAENLETELSETEGEVVSLLKEQLAQQSASLADFTKLNAEMSAALKASEEKIQALNSDIEALKAPVMEVTKRFCVAANLNYDGLETFGTAELINTYNLSSRTVLANFRSGQTARTTGEVERPSPPTKKLFRASEATKLK